MEFDSPIGKSGVQNEQQRRFVVSDESQEEQPQQLNPEELRQLRQQKIQEAGKSTSHVKKRIEMLTGIGSAYRTVECNLGEGYKTSYTLRTLKSKEMRDLVNLTSELSKVQDPNSLYVIRNRALAYSVCKIDNTDIDTVLGVADQDYNTRISTREGFLDELDESFLNSLYSKYQDLMNENAEKFGIKSEQDAKEVSDEMKKSSQGT